MLIAPGTRDVSYIVQVVDDAGVPVTGLVAAGFPALYGLRTGEAAIAFGSLSNLASVSATHADGGVKEISGPPGYYRVDGPDSLVASETMQLHIVGEAADKRVICPPIQVRKDAAAFLAICTKTTGGTALQIIAGIVAGGQFRNLNTADPAATCELTVYLHGSNIAVFTISTGTFGSPNSTKGVYEIEYSNPNLTADRIYLGLVTITYLGVMYQAKCTFTTFP